MRKIIKNSVGNAFLIIVLLVVILLGLVSIGLYFQLSSDTLTSQNIPLQANTPDQVETLNQAGTPNAQGQASINVLPSPEPKSSPEEN